MTEETRLIEFSSVCTDACFMTEAGIAYIYLPNLSITINNQTHILDALLCPAQHGGYTTRLFLAEPFSNRCQNWTVHVILGRRWHTWSWNNVPGNLAPLQILSAHLKALL